ncbi:triokinase/FMN cyclase-like isoform X2 [Aricia agestis]|nr:triokinase/FMN cyclase-like isoform X2 [Aricia agestis]
MASSKTITKKVINSPETCVDDNLRGVVALYPNLQLYPKHRVVTMKTDNTVSKRVAILGGGGSGHEPFTAGLIGNGMLSGSVAGGVFASPPTGHIHFAITQLAKRHSGGVLVFLGNYTGDRLNFGKAIEKAKIDGIKVEGFIVGEDVASSHNKTGGRSMCGEVFIHKMCGAMSAKEYGLESIRDMAAVINKSMATLGVCLSACSLPGQPPLFEIKDDEFELGAGVHGEAGIEKLKMGSAKEIVTLILNKIVDHLKLQMGNRVAVMINNMGGTSLMEMNIIASETKDYLENMKIKAERIYSGHLKTSLEMQGFQICLLHLTKDFGDLWLQLLDAPTDAIGWTGGVMSIRDETLKEDEESLLENVGKKDIFGCELSDKEQKILRNSLQAASEKLIESEELLNRLDSGCGDGDCGITLKKFGKAVLSYLESADLKYLSDILWKLSEMAEMNMGGTSGGIYSLGLYAASQAIISAKTNDRHAWLAALESAMAAITKYGGAEPGDRTMLDTLHAGAVAFKKHLASDLKVLGREVSTAVEDAAKATAKMTARAGRASYVASTYIKDEDAGARGAAIWLQAILTLVAKEL